MTQFVQESLSTIRRRLGYLLFRNKFLYDTVLSPTGSTVTLAKAQRLPTGSLAGNTLYLLNGPAIGALTTVATNEQGTGMLTVLPTFGVTPAVGNTVESWPEGLDPDQVNQFINMAILSVQTQSAVLVKVTPTIATDRLSVTIPSTVQKVARLLYRYADGSRVTLRPRGALDPARSESVFTVDDQTLRLDYAIPSDAVGVQVVGYRAPAFLVLDADVAEVRSDYLMYRAASLLATSQAQGPSLDPEAHGAQALSWARFADEIRATMASQHLSNTHYVDTVY